MKKKDIKKKVREAYSKIAERGCSCCSSSGEETPCCFSTNASVSSLGASEPFLGCGNPVSLISLKEGDVVLDLGCGRGLDCFFAAGKVGESGKVVGLDMTYKMIEVAQKKAKEGGYKNVSFCVGEIEFIPLADSSVDAVVSNCVINLSPEKKRVFKEAFRVLKPGGMFVVSDIVLLRELPEEVRNSMAAYVGCVAGAELKGHYLKEIRSVGFTGLRVLSEQGYLGDIAVSITVSAKKPNK